MPTPITVTMLVKNAERCLAETLNALASFNEVLLLDNGSTDNTLAIAARYSNVTLHHHPFDGFGNMKNRAAALARNDWILNIDSDEIITPELLAAIQQADLTQPENIYALNRINHYQRRPITGCGWSPDIIPRLYNRNHTQYNHRAVHEALIIPQGIRPQLLQGNLNHYTYDSIEALISKMQQYSSLYAEQNAGQKTSPAARHMELYPQLSHQKRLETRRRWAHHLPHSSCRFLLQIRQTQRAQPRNKKPTTH